MGMVVDAWLVVLDVVVLPRVEAVARDVAGFVFLLLQAAECDQFIAHSRAFGGHVPLADEMQNVLVIQSRIDNHGVSPPCGRASVKTADLRVGAQVVFAGL